MNHSVLGARLIYLMGASGSGKDTVLRHIRAALLPNDAIVIAPRTITRASSPDESNVELSDADFDRTVAAGQFALHWQANGLRYGIDRQLDDWLTHGKTVIVNGSRHHLAAASRRYPYLHAVEIRVDPAILRSRLAQRARESAENIEQRLHRGAQGYERPAGTSFLMLENNGAPTDAATRLLNLARELQG